MPAYISMSCRANSRRQSLQELQAQSAAHTPAEICAPAPGLVSPNNPVDPHGEVASEGFEDDQKDVLSEQDVVTEVTPVRVREVANPPGTLPRFEPFSPDAGVSGVSPPGTGQGQASSTAKIKLRLARLQLETEEKVRKADYELKLQEGSRANKVGYLMDEGLLMRRWSSDVTGTGDEKVLYQLVAPKVYRAQVLSLAHDNPWGEYAVRGGPAHEKRYTPGG
uniref:Uncharacterized protein n=1 Tax=Knipowitschia caucasica TaxID=637954 RepID=A0AAV2JZK3_KNICA